MDKNRDIRTIILVTLLVLYFLGVDSAKYFALLYIIAVIFDPKLSITLALFLLPLIPIWVYFGITRLAEAFSLIFYILFSSFVIGTLVRDSSFLTRALKPLNNVTICRVVTFIYFLYALFSQI